MKLWPTRTAHQDDPIADLDAIVCDPVPFRFNGKIHVLKPIELGDFLRFTNAQSVLMRAASNDEAPITPKELAQKFHSVFSSVCETITIDDVMRMSQVQVAALYQLVIDMVTGQVETGDGKKKRQKIPIYDIARASS